MNGLRRAATSTALGLLIPAFVHAAPAAGPLQAMQQQIDFLASQYQALANRLERPKVSLTLSCAGALSATVHLNVTAARDLAYFAFQEQGGDPPANFVTFVQPGASSVGRDVTIAPGSATRTFLLVAADTDGNAAGAVLQVPPDACP